MTFRRANTRLGQGTATLLAVLVLLAAFVAPDLDASAAQPRAVRSSTFETWAVSGGSHKGAAADGPFALAGRALPLGVLDVTDPTTSGMDVYLPLAAKFPRLAHELAPEDYEVLRAVIVYRFGTPRPEQLVIADHTENWWIFGGSEAFRERIADAWPDLPFGTAEQLVERNDRPYKLADSFGLSWPIILISQAEQDQIFRDGGGWEEFYQRYPGAQGIMGLGRVGFSPDYTWALAYMGNQSDWLAGAGILYLLENTGHGWVVSDSMLLWIS
jgi:hypothetical protein